MPDFELKTSVRDGIVFVQPIGDLDLAVAARFEGALDELIRDGQRKLLIDLGQVSFIDSSALATLLRAVRRLRRRRGALAVACPSPQMRGLFELVGHNLLFPVAETTTKARAHLTPPEPRTTSATGAERGTASPAAS